MLQCKRITQLLRHGRLWLMFQSVSAQYTASLLFWRPPNIHFIMTMMKKEAWALTDTEPEETSKKQTKGKSLKLNTIQTSVVVPLTLHTLTSLVSIQILWYSMSEIIYVNKYFNVVCLLVHGFPKQGFTNIAYTFLRYSLVQLLNQKL